MNNTEIERKFLVTGDYKSSAYSSERITQGYLVSDAERAVRVRIKGDIGYITIKGGTQANSISRFEWEKEISIKDAEQLLQLCLPGVIDKVRYLIKSGKHIFEVDEFFGENEGLTIAEIELQSEDESFDKPHWLGEEVTGDKRYYNSQLISNPYKNW
ncbi:CYTH domain-containing protein [Dysgonomonas macrotermitis]|uniref:Adenylate cyclase n=1 Tax=Dysgonomonas macrotermitis TaxID=1346286 RepID=A0A1M5FAE3_9BACT|nr:CYTH domain-containing protein [Dysgonomonas macrotermitis]SHF88560.1 adenylate cyclase [Dysgonomonas macrotermitis]